MKSKSEMLVPSGSCWCFWTALPLGSGWPRRAARRRKRKEQGKMNWISVKDKLPKEVSSHD